MHDASFIASTGETNIGAVTRYNRGYVVLATGQRMSACNSTEEAELAVILCSLSELKRLHNSPICMETDCASVVSLLNSKAKNQSALFPMIVDVKTLLSSFSKVSISSVKRNRTS